jgi:phosphoglycolate phosphatase-like HAD superfamily hydrolase
VILNSNRTKIDAYFSVAKRMGGTDKEAQAFVDYHVKLGSFPRNGKIEYYLEEIVKQPNTPELMQQYLHVFDDVLAETLMQCEIASGLDALKKQTPQARWMVLSGGDQIGLREILARRNLTSLFEADIFGGPDTKDIVLAREKLNGNIQFPALFIGDSKYDYASSTNAGLDFVFLSDWTEVQDWQVFCTENNIQSCNNIQSLI